MLMKIYVSESLFIADNSGKKWNLVSYENKLCKYHHQEISSSGKTKIFPMCGNMRNISIH